jgi:hypothetical protein
MLPPLPAPRMNPLGTFLPLALATFAHVPAATAGTDFELMVGLRNVIATFITDDGYTCPDVKRMTQVRFDEDGNAVLKVICGPLGSPTEWAHKPLRVVAYPEGDYSTARWRDEVPAVSRPSVSTRPAAVAYITQD